MNSQALVKDPSGRQQERTKIRARLKLMHPDTGEVSVFTDNLPDGGLFVLGGSRPLPAVGEIVWLQLQGLPVEAPVVKARIVRQNEMGIGVMFLDPISA